MVARVIPLDRNETNFCQNPEQTWSVGGGGRHCTESIFPAGVDSFAADPCDDPCDSDSSPDCWGGVDLNDYDLKKREVRRGAPPPLRRLRQVRTGRGVTTQCPSSEKKQRLQWEPSTALAALALIQLFSYLKKKNNKEKVASKTSIRF